MAAHRRRPPPRIVIVGLTERLGPVARRALVALPYVSATAWWLFVCRGMWFIWDEWAYWAQRLPAYRRGGTVAFLLEPYNGHLNAGLFAIWAPLDAAFGVERYRPYQLVSLAFHLVFVAAVDRMARHLHLPAAPRFVFVLAVAVLGVGVGNIAFGWQLAWTGATACGTWALALSLDVDGSAARIERLRLGAIVALLLVGTSFGSPIVPWVVAVSASLAVRSRWAAAVAAAVTVALPYLAWRATYEPDAGRAATPPTVAGRFALRGATESLEAWVGLGVPVSLVLVAALGAGAVLVVRRAGVGVDRRPGVVASLTVGPIAGFVVWWVLLGLSRGLDAVQNPGSFAPSSPRYVHVACALLAPVGLALVAVVWSVRASRPALALAAAVSIATGAHFATEWVAPYRTAGNQLRAQVIESCQGSPPAAGLLPEAGLLSPPVIDELRSTGRLRCSSAGWSPPNPPH